MSPLPSSCFPSNAKPLFSSQRTLSSFFFFFFSCRKINKERIRKKKSEMRFFLEFVSCCGSPAHQHAEKPTVSAEEERWLVPAAAISAAPVRRFYRKKQRMGATDWKPSLGSISEDSVASQREKASPRGATVSSAGRDAKKRSTAARSGGGEVRSRSYSDSYSRSAAMPTIIPAFSPTPFMF